MKKNIAELRLFNVVDVLNRIARELRRLCSGSADKLAEILDVIVLSNGWFAPAIAWAQAMRDREDGNYGEHEHTSDSTHVEWSDRYAQCWVYHPEYGRWCLGFTTTGGHGLEITINDDEIEVTADDLASERFWGDRDGDYLEENGHASPQVVSDRAATFLKSLKVDDVEFADREAERRLAAKAEFEKRVARPRSTTPPVTTSIDTARRRAAAKAAKAAIEAKAKAAMAAAFSDNDEV